MIEKMLTAPVMTRRERLREQTTKEIKRVAREQMVREGTASLSLRQIAAAMGMTAPALYRYYASRDDLITALIVDAYNGIAEAVEAAVATGEVDAPAQRLEAGMLAFRTWSVAHATEFALIYGSPIPGYHAPEAGTDEAASRPNAVFLDLLIESWRRGLLTLPPGETSPILAAQLTSWRDSHGYTVPLPFLHTLLSTWSAMYGMIALEVFGHASEIIGDASEFYRIEVRAILARVGLLHLTPDANSTPVTEGGDADTDA